jgi:molecular chaperone GrpE
MSDKRTEQVPTDEVQNQDQNMEGSSEEMVEKQEEVVEKDPLQIALDEIAALNDKHLRLFSDYENFRRRTAKERLELIQSAGSRVLSDILPVLDDLDRAIANNDKVEDIDAVREGFKLIDHKFRTVLKGQGIEPMDAVGKEFDTEFHEAVTKIPAPKKKLKGKVVDVIERGYLLNGKVLRYAKVVVGE